MTAITPADVHAHKLICLTRQIPRSHVRTGCQGQISASPQCSHRNTRKGTGMGQGAAGSLNGRIDVMFCPVITTEALNWAMIGA